MNEISCSGAVNFLIVVYFMFEKISGGNMFTCLSMLKANYGFVTFQQ
jgi:hypothetical protein